MFRYLASKSSGILYTSTSPVSMGLIPSVESIRKQGRKLRESRLLDNYVVDIVVARKGPSWASASGSSFPQ